MPSIAASLTPQSPSRVGVRPLESETGPRACPHLGALGRLDPGTRREWRGRPEVGDAGGNAAPRIWQGPDALGRQPHVEGTLAGYSEHAPPTAHARTSEGS